MASSAAQARINAAREVARAIAGMRSKPSPRKLMALKRAACKRHGLSEMLSNAELLEALPSAVLREKKQFFRTRQVRSLSGVCVVAIMARPAECPHGRCAYCPGGPQNNSPQSYTGREPAAMRASQNGFDSFAQVRARLDQLRAIGHEPQKCELIVMGGTFNAQPLEYQRVFLKRAFEAFNEGTSRSLEAAIKANEGARHRVVGLTFETRPDWATRERISRLVDWGATRIELGVQTLSDEVYKKVERGHSVADVVEATQTCKDALLKVGYHWMPGLLCGPRDDERMFKRLFSDSRFRPDMLKIYPCLVMPGTKMFEWWEKGEFVPYDAETAARVVARLKRLVPPYCRVMRVERDIPVQLIAAGVKKSNLRQLVRKEMLERGWECKCIRCREVGFKQAAGAKIDWSAVELKRFDYEASGGKEVFLSFEEPGADALVAFLRLRLPGRPWRKEFREGDAGVRELHVYGEQLLVGERKEVAAQHKRFGRLLLGEAERIAGEEWGSRKLFVISGVGVRPYYKRLGYAQDGAFVSKKL
ncbi:MAG: tRNA uridine(34) 5-carboxymethylaminomethyl modification radical SAM/GNAT enzyme Elp3 [Candidatus Micrarchaeia archaeon]